MFVSQLHSCQQKLSEKTVSRKESRVHPLNDLKKKIDNHDAVKKSVANTLVYLEKSQKKLIESFGREIDAIQKTDMQRMETAYHVKAAKQVLLSD